MKPKIVLINPWVYDFAAVNLWSLPLGLLKVAELLSRYELELSLIDCTGVSAHGRFGTGRYPKEKVQKPACLASVPRKFGRYGMAVDEFRKTLAEHAPFDLVLLTSIMSYWYPGVQKVIEIIRDSYGKVPVILGGIYATLWHGHAASASGADFIYRGPIGDEIRFVFSTFGFKIRKNTPGRCPGETAHRGTPYYRLGLPGRFSFAPILTSVGCPFTCDYCASRLLSGGYLPRDPADVLNEIRELHDAGICDFAFYDDALLFNADTHIKVILEEVVREGLKIRFHCPNGLHARFIDRELADLMKAAGFVTLRLGLETVNRERQHSAGHKVTSGELSRAVAILKAGGFTKRNIGVYLMYGLPGQDLSEVKEGVEYLKGMDVKIHLAEFSPIPGTRCWQELLDKGVINEKIDPLLTNNTVFPYLFSGYDPEEVEKLKLQVKEYNGPGRAGRDSL